MQKLAPKMHQLIFIILCFILFFTSSVSVMAKENNSFAIKKIREHVYVISHLGKNGHVNLGVVEGDDGLLLINSWMEWGNEEYAAVLKTISNKPVKYVINSNDEMYNHQGSRFWAEQGAVIISHESFKSSPEHHQLLFTDQFSLVFGTERVIAYQGSVDSLGHINIFLEQANVAFIANQYELIGYAEGLDKALSMGNDQTLFVSSIGTKITSDAVGVRKEKASVSQFTQRVRQLYHQGLSINEIADDDLLDEMSQQFEKYTVYKKSLRSKVINIIEKISINVFSLSNKKLLEH